jgi:hypothetical protein
MPSGSRCNNAVININCDSGRGYDVLTRAAYVESLTNRTINNNTDGTTLMQRVLAILVTLLSLTTIAYSETPTVPAAAAPATLFAAVNANNRLLRSLAVPCTAHAPPTALACCKVCSVGKACGNTCISREKTCHVGQGCACDG